MDKICTIVDMFYILVYGGGNGVSCKIFMVNFHTE